jgi:methionyl-tRNA synthetase
MKTKMNKNMINIDQFDACDIRIGTVISADFVEGADKLICFKIDLGESYTDEEGNTTSKTRQILSGIREHYPNPGTLVGLQVPILCNLPTRKLRGLDSEGMILYAVGETPDFTTLSPANKITNGTQVG